MRIPKPLLIAIAFCGFLLVYAWLEMRQSHAAARNAQENLESCKLLAQQISEVQSKPQVASLKDRTVEEITRLVETAAQTSGLPSNQILRIAPESRRRINNSYESRATQIEIGSVTLEQLVQFMDELEGKHSALTVTSLRLVDPSDKQIELQEKWQADVSLDYLIYSPK